MPIERYVNRILLISLAVVLLYFWLAPDDVRDGCATWGLLLLFVISLLGLSLRFSSLLRRWRGLGLLAVPHIAAQGWLQWQWNLWDSPSPLLRNLNAVVTLVVFGTLLGMLVSLLLILIYQDASAIALGAAWLGFPICLIVTMARYQTYERLSSLPLRDSMVLVTPVCLLSFLAVTGGMAFVGHLAVLLFKEISGRDGVQSVPGAKSRG
ncbi:MAG: hypothetical protein M1482_12595 [Chloroflexi bacterium]|nr:hypothetical protein [Chloroflexota bacterium]